VANPKDVAEVKPGGRRTTLAIDKFVSELLT
jgi:hypothetical protein